MVDAVERGVFFNITFVSSDVVANVCALVVYVFFAICSVRHMRYKFVDDDHDTHIRFDQVDLLQSVITFEGYCHWSCGIVCSVVSNCASHAVSLRLSLWSFHSMCKGICSQHSGLNSMVYNSVVSLAWRC